MKINIKTQKHEIKTNLRIFFKKEKKTYIFKTKKKKEKKTH